MAEVGRAERLQIMLTDDELKALDDWRFSRRMPSRASAVRELLKRGLTAEGFETADGQTTDYKAQPYEFGVDGHPASAVCTSAVSHASAACRLSGQLTPVPPRPQ